MASALDLEEQEQLDQLRHFWRQYGNLITWVLIAILGSFAAWNGYQYWQRSQAAQAAALFDEVERLVVQADSAKLERAVNDMRERFPRTTYAQQSVLMLSKVQHDAGNNDAARASLAWVAEKASDDGYKAIARLRLAALLAQGKSYADAMAQLDGDFPDEFAPLVADRKGDILALQDKKAEARQEYEKAWKGLEARSDYRRLVEIKLNALGVDPRPAAEAGAAAEGQK